MRKLIVLGSFAALAVVGVLFAVPAGAALPGVNGQIAYTLFDQNGVPHVFVANPDGKNAKELPVDGASPSVWSPGGGEILLTVCCPNGAPKPAVINADGTGFNLLNVSGLPTDGALDCRAWSPNASQLLCDFGGTGTDHSLDGIYTIRVSDGAVLKRLTVNPYPPTGDFGGGDIPGDYSPDGSQFVFMRAKPGAGPAPDRNQSGALFVENIDGTGLHQITPYGLANSHDHATESWSPDGSEILFATDHPNGTGGRLEIIHPDGTGLRTLPLQGGSDYSFAFAPGWSPDGTKIIFALFTGTGRTGKGADEGIYTANADGSNLTQITSGGGYDLPDWGEHAPTP